MPASGRSRRAWGWHRLADDWAARVVAAAGVPPGELVLDIGAGEGALTAHLVRAGARVVAADLVLQRAVVRKYAAGPGRGFSLTAGLALPRRAFLPPPHVDSAVLVVRRRR